MCSNANLFELNALCEHPRRKLALNRFMLVKMLLGLSYPFWLSIVCSLSVSLVFLTMVVRSLRCLCIGAPRRTARYPRNCITHV